MTNDERYNKQKDDNPTEFGLNWQHYLDASRICHDFISSNFSDVQRSDQKDNSVQYISTENITVAEANKLQPVEGYLSFYCDLLGFSAEIASSNTDSLPDFYGAAFGSAAKNPKVKVYLISDTCLAFAPTSEALSFVNFISFALSNWTADGLLPRSYIGYGSFIERVPDLGAKPANFFGVQVGGTALVDAADIEKNSRPLGSRILISRSARDNLLEGLPARIILDGKGNLELFLERPKQYDLFECLYYLLCLRDHVQGSRVFDQYIWSVASRAVSGGCEMLRLAEILAAPHYPSDEINDIMGAIEAVLEEYGPAES